MASEELGGPYADLYDFSDGELEVRWQEQVLPYRVFDKNQRVLTYRTFDKAQRFVQPPLSRTRDVVTVQVD